MNTLYMLLIATTSRDWRLLDTLRSFFVGTRLLSPRGVAEAIVAEKRMLSPRSQIELCVEDPEYMKRVVMPAKEFARMLSDLIHVSLDAFAEDAWITNPRIAITITKFDESLLRVTVQDNAGGITHPIKANDCLLNHGGRIVVSSKVGFGSIVTIFIPVE